MDTSNERRTLREWMQELARRPRPRRQAITVTCGVCGRVFTASSRRRRYCSDACTAKAWRQRHPDYAARRRAQRQARQRPHADTPTEPEPAP
jgi:hypothetical protein